MHLVFSVQEEFNLRGAVTAAQALKPDIAIQLDLMLATDTPDMAARGDVRLGGGPAMSLYSFHGRGTLNGTIPHPALVALFDGAAKRREACRCSAAPISARSPTLPMCSSSARASPRSISAFPAATRIRRSRSATSAISTALTRLLVAALAAIDAEFSLDRDDFIRMSTTLGIDIGTFESKGVLVDGDGPDRRERRQAAQDARAAAGLGRAPAERGLVGRLHLSQPQAARRQRGCRRPRSGRSGRSAIGPCMLPVDADGEPLMNAVLYGVDTRAAQGDRRADGRDRRGRAPRRAAAMR